MANDLIYEQTIYIAKPAEVVWQALVDKPQVDRYYLAPLGKAPVEGQEIYYGTEAQKLIRGKVLKLEKPKIFSHSFIFSHRPQEESVITYEVEPMGQMSALHLLHRQLSKKGWQDVNGGWPVILSNLKTLLETGQLLPWPKSQPKE